MSAHHYRLRRRIAIVLAALTALWCLVCAAELVWPDASGKTRYSENGTTVDASNAADGYVMAKHSGSGKRLKLRVSRGDDMATYDLNNEGAYEVFPLQFGSGTYKVSVYAQVSGNQYTQVSAISFKADLVSKYAPYLCPSQYVWYTAGSQAVKLSNELCQGLTATSDKVSAIYTYVTTHVQYNYIQALTVSTGYLPDVDQVLASGQGICFDYAALMAAMLRAQEIPTQLVIGYADKTYHAWNNINIDGDWWRYDATAKVTHMSVSSYTEERRY